MKRNRKKIRRVQNIRKILIIAGICVILCGVSIGAALYSDTVMNMLGFSRPQPIVNPTTGESFIKDLNSELHKKGIQFSQIHQSSSSARIYTEIDKTTVVFAQNRKAGEQVSSLQAILTRLTIEDKQAKLIDLRFNKPIVKF